MTFEFHDISPRTKLLILLLSLLINSTIIILILNSRRQQFITMPAQVIKLEEEEIIAPSQFMQPMTQSMQAPSAAQSLVTQQQQQQPQPMPQQQDFEWVSGASGGMPAAQEKAQAPKEPEALPQETYGQDEDGEEEAFDSMTTEVKDTVELTATDPFTIPAGSAIIAEEPATLSKQEVLKKAQEKRSGTITKPLPSLADITKNFMDFTHDEQAGAIGAGGIGSGGLHSMNVAGGKSGPVSEKQLTYERYLRKILVCVSTSCKIHKREIPRTAQKSQARVQFVLNRDGTYYTLGMAQSSGNPAIDDLILTIFKDAESSFPPVPQSLTVPLILPLFILNSVQELLTPEAWSVTVGG